MPMRKPMWTAALLLASLITLAQPLGLRHTPTASATEAPTPAPTTAPAPASTPAAQQSAPAAQQSAAVKQTTDELDASIERWRKALAVQPDFAAWRDASWTSYPLGPGTHSFVVLLTHDGQEVGYMIVSATPDGSYRLTEYGTGNKPLFSLSTLYRSLVQQELIESNTSLAQFLNDTSIKKERLYTDPFHAVWKLTFGDEDAVGSDSVYIDAKTGERLPVDETMLPVSSPASSAGIGPAAETVADSLLLPVFNPYERISWVQGDPLPLSVFADVKQALAGKQRLTLVVEPFGGAITVPLAVIGYHVWPAAGGEYVALDQDGARYVSFESLHTAGRFFS
jgi:hypothetical protein